MSVRDNFSVEGHEVDLAATGRSDGSKEHLQMEDKPAHRHPKCHKITQSC